jgi:hypothetical protein
MIRVETSKRTGIDNIQVMDVSAFERNWSVDIPKRYPRATQRTEMSPLYNCHGLTFASRRTRITDNDGIQRILADDMWTEIKEIEVLPGDIVIYYSEEGDPNHSGVIVDVGALKVPTICSKWGTAGEFTHLLNYCPDFYGPITKYYRCRL